MNITTWNMQGGNATTEVKWQTGVMNAMRSSEKWKPDLMCLQECGGMPGSASAPVVIPAGVDPAGVAQNILLSTYGGTQTRPEYYIAFHNWDVAGNRVNTAIIGRGSVPAAADVRIAWAAAGPTWRPAIGVGIAGLGWVFSFHAISPGGPDAPQMVAAVAAIAGATPWYIGGDWNREPNTFALPAASIACPPQGATYPVKDPVSKYDFIVRSGAAKSDGVRLSLICSDHFPQAFMF